jgi:putative ABC transport system permease protein
MLIYEPVRMAINAIVSHRLRSFLTLLGVIIGVMTIIAMMSVIQGLQVQMEKQMSQLTADVFQLQRWDAGISFNDHDRGRTRPKVTIQEAMAIPDACPSVTMVGPEVWEYGQWVARDKIRTNPNIQLAGGYPEFAPNNGYDVARGRFLTMDDVQHERPVIVLGDALATKLFPFEDPLEKEVRLEKGRFKVVGVFESMGSSFGHSNDNQMAIPFTTFTKLYGKGRSINVTIKAKSPDRFKQAQDEVISLMRRMRGLKPDEPDNFAIWSPENLIDDFNKMYLWVQAAAVGICSISLLVAGIGIMNIMLVSVTERTREIGVRLAIGARRRQILGQFLVEAVILSELGGIVGAIIGIALPLIAAPAMGLPVTVPIWSVVLGLAFCSVVGIGFGMWPAMRASKLDPVEALRYE